MADDGRTYIRLHDGMPDHPKVEPLSDKSFRLLVSTWAWCSRHLTDGRVPRTIWVRRGTPAARRELVTAGLVEDLGAEGVHMHDYLEHQRSRSQVEEIVTTRREARAAASVKGNHRRWHVGPDGKPSDDCPLCHPNVPKGSGGTPKGIGSGTPSGSHIGIGTDIGIGTVLPEETLGGGAPDATAPDASAPTPHDPPCEKPCQRCKAARLAAEAATAVDPRAAARAAFRAAVDACGLCDDQGMRPLDNGGGGVQATVVRCDHQPIPAAVAS